MEANVLSSNIYSSLNGFSASSTSRLTKIVIYDSTLSPISKIDTTIRYDKVVHWKWVDFYVPSVFGNFIGGLTLIYLIIHTFDIFK